MAASDGGSRLDVESLGFAYGARTVLADIGLRARPGEIVGLIGPNGSGKSTLIKIVSGVLGNYAGHARIDDIEIRDASRAELAQRMAVVPQEPVISFPFTALEVVLMGRHPHLAGLEFESERDIALAREALGRCGVSDFASRPIQDLSSGERQRVIFAKALAQQPRALLLDEPASFLDIRHQVELYDIVRELASDRGCTVLTVLHDLNLASEYCDRIYLLQRGRIEAEGPVREVLTYANLKRVFETEIYVDTNTLTGNLLVVPLPGRARNEQGPGDPPAPEEGT